MPVILQTPRLLLRQFTQSAAHSLKHGFKKLDIKLISLRTHTENLAAINVLEKIGMNFIGEQTLDNCPVRTYTTSNPY